MAARFAPARSQIERTRASSYPFSANSSPAASINRILVGSCVTMLSCMQFKHPFQTPVSINCIAWPDVVNGEKLQFSSGSLPGAPDMTSRVCYTVCQDHAWWIGIGCPGLVESGVHTL